MKKLKLLKVKLGYQPQVAHCTEKHYEIALELKTQLATPKKKYMLQYTDSFSPLFWKQSTNKKPASQKESSSRQQSEFQLVLSIVAK